MPEWRKSWWWVGPGVLGAALAFYVLVQSEVPRALPERHPTFTECTTACAPRGILAFEGRGPYCECRS